MCLFHVNIPSRFGEKSDWTQYDIGFATYDIGCAQFTKTNYVFDKTVFVFYVLDETSFFTFLTKLLFYVF